MEGKEAAEFILDILHDTPTEKICRYYPEEEQECLYKIEDEDGGNWCNNCPCWHAKVSTETGAQNIYQKHPGATALHASLLKDLYHEDN